MLPSETCLCPHGSPKNRNYRFLPIPYSLKRYFNKYRVLYTSKGSCQQQLPSLIRVKRGKVSLFGFDQTIAAVVAAIDYTDVVGVRVLENEEIVSQHIHLHDRFLRIHRF